VEYTFDEIFGDKHWFYKGKYHRENGPAIEWYNGNKEWYIHGKRHREDGPAVECFNGIKEYWINDKQLTEQEFNNRNKKLFTIDEIKNMSLKELHNLIS
jgi:hypothetical protein